MARAKSPLIKINGFLVPPGDITEFKNVIFKLIKDKELYIKMSLSSLSQYETLAPWDETMNQIYRFFS